jgi:hypothetical protein
MSDTVNMTSICNLDCAFFGVVHVSVFQWELCVHIFKAFILHMHIKHDKYMLKHISLAVQLRVLTSGYSISACVRVPVTVSPATIFPLSVLWCCHTPDCLIKPCTYVGQ